MFIAKATLLLWEQVWVGQLLPNLLGTGNAIIGEVPKMCQHSSWTPHSNINHIYGRGYLFTRFVCKSIRLMNNWLKVMI